MKSFPILSSFILCGTVFSAPLYAEAQVLDRVVAVVNDDAITQSELDMHLRPIYHQMKQEYQGQEAALNRQLGEIRGKLLNQLIEDRLVYQKAQEMKIEVKEEELEREIANFKSQFKSETEFETTMRREGFSLVTVKEKLTRQLLIRRLQDMEVRSRVVVTPVEVENYYKGHAAEFVEKAKVRVRSITIKKNEQARDKGLTDEDARQRMDAIVKRVTAHPEGFAEEAMKNSEDYQAPQGGLGDWVERGSMIPVIEEAIFQLKKGEMSKIIETPMGYHLFKMEDRTEGKERTFEEVKEEIYNRIYRDKAQARFNEWMEKLKREAYISLRN